MSTTESESSTLQLETLQKELDAVLKQYQQVYQDNIGKTFVSEVKIQLHHLNSQMLYITEEMQKEVEKSIPLYESAMMVENAHAKKIKETYNKLLLDKAQLDESMNEYETLQALNTESLLNVDKNYFKFRILLAIAFTILFIIFRVIGQYYEGIVDFFRNTMTIFIILFMFLFVKHTSDYILAIIALVILYLDYFVFQKRSSASNGYGVSNGYGTSNGYGVRNGYGTSNSRYGNGSIYR